MSNLVPIEGTGKQDKLRDSLRQLEQDLPALIEIQKFSVRMTREKFKCLLAEGFTEAQALELCK